MGEGKGTQRPARTGGVLFSAGRGVVLGIFAGVAQVMVAQAVGLATGRRERTDIAPRLVQRTAERLGTSLSRPLRWLLATVFHFGYASGWGGLYALARASRRGRRVPAWLSGGLLGGAIYAVAFSRLGAGTQLGSERPPERREWRELLIQWASALSFALTVAYTEGWSRRGGDGDGQAGV
jgi:hypothetical protein